MQAIATEAVVAPPDRRAAHVSVRRPGYVSALYDDAELRDLAEWDVHVGLVTRSPEQCGEMISDHVSLAVAAQDASGARSSRGARSSDAGRPTQP